MRQQGTAAQSVQHFGQRAFHPRAFARGHDDDIDWGCHEISCKFFECEASGSAGWTRILFTDYRSAGIGRAAASLQIKNGLNKLQMWHLKIQWPGYSDALQKR